MAKEINPNCFEVVYSAPGPRIPSGEKDIFQCEWLADRQFEDAKIKMMVMKACARSKANKP